MLGRSGACGQMPLRGRLRAPPQLSRVQTTQVPHRTPGVPQSTAECQIREEATWPGNPRAQSRRS
jgi:hypothetical protein